MRYKYWLPNEDLTKREIETDARSLVIIGPNGSGKSKLGAWIEQQDKGVVHRIGGQRNLNFKEHTPMMSYTEAEERMFFGTNDKRVGSLKISRWGRDFEKSTTKLIDDFDDTLAAIISKHANEQDDLARRYKKAFQNGTKYPEPKDTVLDTLCNIWNAVLPHRQLSMSDARFCATFADSESGDNKSEYSANQMSDGERSVLYLAAQVLCVPEKVIIVIDEPEAHLHPSLLTPLWNALEDARQDCFFIYITHDVGFASSRAGADKLWVKNFNGTSWCYDSLQETDLPDSLLDKLRGCRRPILFVESESGKYDEKLYTELYPEWNVVPCGSCEQVIVRTRAFANNPSLHDCKVRGVIDRDYRPDEEIESLRSSGVYCLEVAEIENLFIVEEVLQIMAAKMGLDETDAVENAKAFVIDTKFKNLLPRQIRSATVAEIKHRLNTLEIALNEGGDPNIDLATQVEEIDCNEIQRTKQEAYEAAYSNRDYAAILRMFNEKGLAKCVGSFFNIANREYCNTILRLLRYGDDSLRKALMRYIPNIQDR